MEDNDTTARPELGRWIFVAAVIVAGIVLFFMFAPGLPPAVVPSVAEIVP